MKVLFFIHSLGGGGAERVTTSLANYWAAEGLEVGIVTHASREADCYPLDASVARFVLGDVTESSNPVAAVRANWRRIAALRELIKRERPDVVVSMMVTANVLLAIAAFGLPGIKRIGSERVHPPLWAPGFAWSVLRAISYRYLTAVVAQTRKSQKWIESRTSARRVEVIPNPVSDTVANSRRAVSPHSVGSPGRMRLLGVGRLQHQKGFDLLIDAFGELSRQFPDWELVILGEGPRRQDLEEQIEARSLSALVFLPGEVGNMDEWYRSGAVYVGSSRFEGFPNALVEAMAHGLPAISFNCDTGPADIIRDEVDGLLVAPGDTAGLKDAMRRLMGDESSRASLGARAIEVRDRFSLARVSSLWFQLFGETTQ